MLRSTVLAAVLASLSLAACRGPEVVISNPISSGALEANHIRHPSRWMEGQSGLPEGALANEAKLVAADPNRLCFQLTTRVPNDATLDLTRVNALLKSSTGTEAQALVNAQAPAVKSYNGLVPQRERVGTTITCTDRDPNSGMCRTYDAQAKTATVFVPGIVQVREQSGDVCFRNNGLLAAGTEKLELQFSQEGHRFERYRWGFGQRP